MSKFATFKIDFELNSIWSRLTKKLSSEEKEKLVKEQKEWIKQKEANANN